MTLGQVIQDDVEPGLVELAVSWRLSRRCLPEMPETASFCQVGGCGALAFARLRTVKGRRCVCLRHYKTISGLAFEACEGCRRRVGHAVCPAPVFH